MEQRKGIGYIKALQVVAWIELIAAGIMSIVAWSKVSDIENTINMDNFDLIDQMKSAQIRLGFTYLIGGIIIFILFMAVYYIGTYVIEILENTPIVKKEIEIKDEVTEEKVDNANNTLDTTVEVQNENIDGNN